MRHATFLLCPPAALRRAETVLAAALAAVLLLAAAVLPAAAAEQYPSGPDHRGLINFDPYEVFPENRPGNGVYLDNVKVFSLPGRAVIDVLPLPPSGRFAYLAQSPEGDITLGVRTTENDGEVRIDPVTDDVFHVVIVLDGVVYKKVFRLIDENILDLLPTSRTADGVVAGPEGRVAFYHVATADREEVNGQERSIFGMRVHVSLGQDERLRSLDYLIRNTLPSLELAWEDANTLVYTLADGRTGRLTLPQFQEQ